ncbi:MAG: hypothetical protein HYV76_02140 [Candidatus Vogelbacteria bacterium]|nr:hypothetical protein [Candidatus Vogelbacteria bacterium]
MNQRGFIKWIIVVVVGIFILTLLRVDIRGIVNSDIGQSNFNYLWELINGAWDWLVWFWGAYLREPFWLIVNALQLPRLWEVFKDSIARGIPTISATGN